MMKTLSALYVFVSQQLSIYINMTYQELYTKQETRMQKTNMLM